MSDGRAEKLKRARGYPYAFPRECFTYRDGGVDAFDPKALKGRTPVLAFGSNQSPNRLRDKFGAIPDSVIPVERAELEEFDVVYSAHLTRYGAAPAMLQHAPGARVEVAITWLDDAQMTVMHDSEIGAANYFYAAMENVALTTRSGAVHRTVFAYFGTRGHLPHDKGGAIALSAVRCENRRFKAMNTADALETVRRRLQPESGSDDFILKAIDDHAHRATLTEALAKTAEPFAYPVRPLG